MAMASPRASDDDDNDDMPMSEINVTPMVDVMLVLLIIFMVAAPLATVDIKVNLPASSAEQQKRPDKPLFLTIKSDLTVALGNDIISRESLSGTIDTAAKGDKDARIFLRADREVAYGDLMGVMNTLRDTGYLKIALVGLESTTGAVPPAPASAEPAQ